MFFKDSGLKVNIEKSLIFPISAFRTNCPDYLDSSNFTVTYSPVKYLGIVISHREDDFFKLNYLPKLSRIKNLINVWSSRDMTPLGKVVILKNFAVTQLVYLRTVLPLSLFLF